MQIKIPQISTQERGRVFTDTNYVYYNFFNSPTYGALNRRHDDYNERHIFMNNLLKDIYITHGRIMNENFRTETYSYQHSHYKLLFMIESLIYWVRKNADDMIGFNYYAFYFSKHGTEPTKLDISSIGNLLHSKNHELYAVFQSHINKLERINEVSNTFKHSFITSEAHNLIGKDEPVVNCLDIRRNNASNQPEWHSYFLRQIIEDYDSFFELSRETLKKFKWDKS